MNKLLLICCFVLTLCLMLACNSSVSDTEKPISQSYFSKEIGWTIEIPVGYKLTSQTKMDADDQKGKEAIEKVYEGNLKIDSLKHLISFIKNQFNSFDSTIEPYEETETGEYAANNILNKV